MIKLMLVLDHGMLQWQHAYVEQQRANDGALRDTTVHRRRILRPYVQRKIHLNR